MKNEYNFTKKLVPDKTGYEVSCIKYLEIDGEKKEVVSAIHLYEEDYNKPIPEDIIRDTKYHIDKAIREHKQKV